MRIIEEVRKPAIDKIERIISWHLDCWVDQSTADLNLFESVSSLSPSFPDEH